MGGDYMGLHDVPLKCDKWYLAGASGGVWTRLDLGM